MITGQDLGESTDVCRVSTDWSLVAAFGVTHASLPATGSTTASKPFIWMS